MIIFILLSIITANQLICDRLWSEVWNDYQCITLTGPGVTYCLYVNNSYCVLLTNVVGSTSNCWVAAMPANKNWSSVTFGLTNDQYVIVVVATDYNYAAYSSDFGYTWYQSNEISGDRTGWYSITYDTTNNIYITLSTDGTVANSSDGITWLSITPTPTSSVTATPSVTTSTTPEPSNISPIVIVTVVMIILLFMIITAIIAGVKKCRNKNTVQSSSHGNMVDILNAI